ncbi:MAG: MoxR family ATPase [Deltaproteobacteria bacterium]
MEQRETPSEEEIARSGHWIGGLRQELGSVIVGQVGLIDRLLTALLTGGHILLEGVPGLAKTLTLKTLADAVHGRFQRLQFTPDMLPADIVGTQIYNPRESSFETRRGPVFANLVLADEINRAPAKVQSALLEAMQEGQVTIGDETFALPSPFLVMATQNPIEQEGTYPLPEAQVDRFMLKVQVDYPSVDEELLVLDRMANSTQPATVREVVSLEAILEARCVVDRIHIDEKIRRYIVNLVHATRRPGDFGLALESLIQWGASPRATINLARAARAWAFLAGRAYVVPQDIKEIGLDVLRHRVIPSYEAEAEDMTSVDLVEKIFSAIAVP